MKKFYKFSCISCLVVLSLLQFGCTEHEEKAEDEVFTVTNPLRSDQILVREFVAQIQAIQHIELRALEKGYLQKTFVDEGQTVKKGQKMFEIMPLLNKAEFQKAQAELKITEIEYQNTQSLAAKNVVSASELALYKAKFEKAEAQANMAKVHLDFNLVKAPFNGIMDRYHARLGSLLEEGELLTTLSDNSKMWVYFNVSEKDYLNIKANDKNFNSTPIKLKMANGQFFNQPGKIDLIEADFNNETGNIAFRASFPNPDSLLRHGETGNVVLSLTVKDVLVIPQKASYEVLEKHFVYVVDDKNEVKSREIKIQAELPHLYVIASGLETTDKVIIEGIAKVEAGQKIKVVFEEPKKVLSELNVAAE